MRSSFFLVFILSICVLSLNGQQAPKLLLSGKVIDAETKEPLPFASIGIYGKPLGTITNLQGEFDFHFPGEFRNDNLVVTMMGFKNYEAPIWTILGGQPLIIELQKSVLILKEVIVSDSLNGGDVMRIALGRIEENYPMKPFLLEGFYRDVKKVAGTYISLLEAAVSIYDDDYSKPRNKFKLHERVALKEVRRSYGYGNKFTAFFDQGNLLEDLLLANSIRYRQIAEDENFLNNLKREKDSFYNNEDVYVVSNTDDLKFKVYVSKKNFGIIHLENEHNNNLKLQRKRGLHSKYVKEKWVVDFKYFNGKLYPNYITVDSQINWYDNLSGELQFETELNRQLLINLVDPNTTQRISSNQKMKSYGLQYQDQPYNKEFWDNYNLIKETPLDKKIQSDLEKAGPLERQFKDQ